RIELIYGTPPVLLSEQEYRSHGLRGEIPNNKAPIGPLNGGPSNYEPYKTDQEREGVQPDAVSFSRSSKQETMHLQKPSLTPPPTLMTEEDYRSYGLRGERHNNLTPDGPSTSLSFCMILCSNKNATLVKLRAPKSRVISVPKRCTTRNSYSSNLSGCVSEDLNIKYPKPSLAEDSSASVLQALRRSNSIFTLVYVAVQMLKKTLARASVQLG
ncbi:hypothetical protein Tco_0546386, partial [Tanacetum coccineum]